MSDSNAAEPLEPARAKFDFKSLNTLAVVSLASAVSGVGALMAIITGHISLAQIKSSGESGRSMAVIGLVLGYIGIFLGIIFVIGAVVSTALVFSDLSGLQTDKWGWIDSPWEYDGFMEHRGR